MLIDAFLLDAIGKARILLGWNFERAEHPVPNCENAAEIAVEMLRVVRVMNLMMSGGQDDPSPDAAKRDPELRMLQMADGPEEAEEKNVFPVDGKGFRISAIKPSQQAGGAADENRKHVAEDDVVD